MRDRMEHTASHFWTFGFTNAQRSNPAVANINTKTTVSSFRESRSIDSGLACNRRSSACTSITCDGVRSRQGILLASDL